MFTVAMAYKSHLVRTSQISPPGKPVLSCPTAKQLWMPWYLISGYRHSMGAFSSTANAFLLMQILLNKRTTETQVLQGVHCLQGHEKATLT